MKKIITYICTATFLLTLFNSCKKDVNHSLGTVNPFAAIFVVKNAYKGIDLQLDADKLAGAISTGGIVISDATNGNIPKGTVVIQNTDRGITRGLIIELGNSTIVPFMPGDSVVVKLTGSSLVKDAGSLRLRGLGLSAITKISAGKVQKTQTVPSNIINANPLNYEGTLVTVTNGTFEPKPTAAEIFSGNKVLNDGFGKLTLHTEATATFANQVMTEGVNVVGILFASTGATGINHQVWPRSSTDIVPLKSLETSSVLITGYLVDPNGTDANHEYIQFLATENIDFAVTPFAVVTTNNAGSNIPIGFPVDGWATGNQRTYKFNLTAGKVNKGEYFYVGGANKLINGAGSTDISNAKWIRNIAYNTEVGDDFGAISTNLLANSGNPGGIAIFKTTNITASTVPVDVVFWGTAGNGSVFTAGPPPIGYRITNTDYYDTLNPTTQVEQPMFNQGSNTGRFPFPAAISFAKLGGIYNTSKGRWTVGRTLTNVAVAPTATISEIEGGTSLEQ